MCGQKQTNKENSSKKEEKELGQTTQIEVEDIKLDSALLFEDELSRNKLLTSYNSKYSIDTTLILGFDTLNVSFRHHCLFDSAIHVPGEYYYSNKGLVSHNFISELVLKQQDSIIHVITIRKEDFNVDGILTEELLSKGSLLFSTFRGVNDKGEIEVHYSITIPATDIGIGVSALVNKQGELNVLES
jgi:hypothetical protein